MKTLHLKAANEAALIEALPFARYEDSWITATHEFSLDIIGDLYTPGIYEGEVCIMPAVKLEGFHANLILINEDLFVPEEIIINPSNPQRVWA